MTILDNIKLDIPRDTGKDFLKKVMGAPVNISMEDLYEEKASVCIENIAPKGIYNRFPIDRVDGDKVYFQTGDVFDGPHIAKILTGSKTAIITIYTLGNRIDEIIHKTNQSGDILAAIIMDTITTSLLEILGEFVGEKIRNEGIEHKTWGATCAYSPGQYKWTIEEQRKIFDMVDGRRIGVELNDSFLMVPFKSVSGVYGFGLEGSIDKTKAACDLCPRVNCIGRR